MAADCITVLSEDFLVSVRGIEASVTYDLLELILIIWEMGQFFSRCNTHILCKIEFQLLDCEKREPISSKK